MNDPLDRLIATPEQVQFWRAGYEFGVNSAVAEMPHTERLGGYGELIFTRGHILDERRQPCPRCRLEAQLSPKAGKAT